MKNQGEQMLSTTTKQCCTWLNVISRDDLTGDHFQYLFMKSILYMVKDAGNSLANHAYV